MHIAHEDYLIDLVDENGSVISQKLRKDVDKLHDLYHGIYVLVITPDQELVLSRIPKRDTLPNLYDGRIGLTAATIRRHSETKDEAAARALANETHIDARLNHLGDFCAELPDGHKSYISAYYVINDIPATYSKKDIAELITMSCSQLDANILNNPNILTPTLSLVWKKHRQLLPIA